MGQVSDLSSCVSVGLVCNPMDLLADLDANALFNVDDVEAFVASFLAGCP